MNTDTIPVARSREVIHLLTVLANQYPMLDETELLKVALSIAYKTLSKGDTASDFKLFGADIERSKQAGSKIEITVHDVQSQFPSPTPETKSTSMSSIGYGEAF